MEVAICSNVNAAPISLRMEVAICSNVNGAPISLRISSLVSCYVRFD